MSKSLIDLLSILDIEQLEVNMFRGVSPKTRWQRVFGGQVIGQAMVAACRTVEGRPAAFTALLFHPARRSADSDCLRSRATARRQELFDAARHRDPAWTRDLLDHGVVPCRGRRRVRSSGQDARRAAAREADGGGSRQAADLQGHAGIHPALLRIRPPIELRPVELGRYFGQKIEDGRIHIWIRTVAKLPDDPALHLCALAYASDFSLLDAAMAR